MESRANSQKFGSARGGLKRDSFDSEYVRRLRDGDAETGRHFAGYFGELLSIKLRARLRHSQAIEDLRQETLVRVLTALKSKNGVHSPESLGSFVNSVCNNLLFEMYRHDSRHRTVDLDDRFDPRDDRPSAESAMVAGERCEEVQKVLEDLPPRDRELLRLILCEDFDRAQICRAFRVNREYLRVLMHRAKARLRQRLLSRANPIPGPATASGWCAGA